MSGFTADWLALREPADHAARSNRVTAFVTEELGRPLSDASVDGRSPGQSAIRVLDLGSGTGSNFRYLSRRLPEAQQWLLVDNDPALLARARPQTDVVPRPNIAPGTDVVSTRCADLSVLDESLFAGRALVTGSALLDLVSDAWMHALAVHCRAAGAAVLFALTYDGRTEWSPGDGGDQRIRELVNQHQRGDKGFGAALGPAATDAAARHLADQGYRVVRDRSDWVLDRGHAALQKELLEGSAHAAVEMAPGESAAIHAWLTRRLEHLAAGRSRTIVGHEDLAAVLG
jgi:SAM-dependent methyltransferase